MSIATEWDNPALPTCSSTPDRLWAHCHQLSLADAHVFTDLTRGNLLPV